MENSLLVFFIIWSLGLYLSVVTDIFYNLYNLNVGYVVFFGLLWPLSIWEYFRNKKKTRLELLEKERREKIHQKNPVSYGKNRKFEGSDE